MPSLTPNEELEITRANQSGRIPVVFVHGLWLLPSSWQRWRDFFEAEGYVTLAPGWPDDPDTVAEAREHPELFAGKSLGAITDHFANVIVSLTHQPVVIGHSFGGVIAQKLAGMGLSRTTVAIDPAPFRGVLPLPKASLKSASPVLSNPANYRRAVALTFEQFVYGWANTLPEEEARDLYNTYHVPGAGLPLFQAAAANLNPWTEDKVDTRSPERGPLLLVSGEHDNTAPWAVVRAAYERQKINRSATEILSLADRGHSLIIDHGWKQVADEVMSFVVEYSGNK